MPYKQFSTQSVTLSSHGKYFEKLAHRQLGTWKPVRETNLPCISLILFKIVKDFLYLVNLQGVAESGK